MQLTCLSRVSIGQFEYCVVVDMVFGLTGDQLLLFKDFVVR